MKNSSFNEEQEQTLLDLLVLGMYVDAHLSSAEDERIQKVLRGFDFESDYARQQFGDCSFTRAARFAESPEEMRSFVTSAASTFKTEALRREAFSLLGSLLASDGKFSKEESTFLVMVRDIFEL